MEMKTTFALDQHSHQMDFDKAFLAVRADHSFTSMIITGLMPDPTQSTECHLSLLVVRILTTPEIVVNQA